MTNTYSHKKVQSAFKLDEIIKLAKTKRMYFKVEFKEIVEGGVEYSLYPRYKPSPRSVLGRKNIFSKFKTSLI